MLTDGGLWQWQLKDHPVLLDCYLQEQVMVWDGCGTAGRMLRVVPTGPLTREVYTPPQRVSECDHSDELTVLGAVGALLFVRVAGVGVVSYRVDTGEAIELAEERFAPANAEREALDKMHDALNFTEPYDGLHVRFLGIAPHYSSLGEFEPRAVYISQNYNQHARWSVWDAHHVTLAAVTPLPGVAAPPPPPLLRFLLRGLGPARVFAWYAVPDDPPIRAWLMKQAEGTAPAQAERYTGGASGSR
jgi:hypothetical protein